MPHFQTRPCALSLAGQVNWEQRRLHNAFASIGFDPTADGSEWFLSITDTHMCAGTAMYGRKFRMFHPSLRKFLLALKAEPTAPKFVLHLGDMLTYFVETAGSQPVTGNPTLGAKEAAWFNMAARQLSALAPLKIILGNHDTPVDEVGGLGAFVASHITEWSGLNHAMAAGGVQVLATSCNHEGSWTAGQDDWFVDELKKNSGEDLILAWHMPGGGRTVGWHSAMRFHQIMTLFPDVGKVTRIVGHDHRYYNAQAVLPDGRVIDRRALSNGGDPVMLGSGDGANPTLQAFACRKGKLVGVVYGFARRQCWQVAAGIAGTPGTAVTDYWEPLAADTITQGYRGDKNRLDDLATNPNTGNWNFYGTGLSLIKQLDLTLECPASSRRFFVCLSWNPPDSVEFSIDGNTWFSAPGPFESKAEFRICALPSEVVGAGGEMFVQMHCSGHPYLSGFGFLT